MPKRYNSEEEEQDQQNWSPIILRKEPILTNSNVELTIDQFIHKIIQKREELKLSQLQLNTKCKFSYKYTIRDIESTKTQPTAFEVRTISTILNI
jgi:ribosome-binding protein aMBF1 (putative translation factor)